MAENSAENLVDHLALLKAVWTVDWSEQTWAAYSVEQRVAVKADSLARRWAAPKAVMRAEPWGAQTVASWDGCSAALMAVY